ncbi:transmembrane protein 276-like [Lithobates pipiens]
MEVMQNPADRSQLSAGRLSLTVALLSSPVMGVPELGLVASYLCLGGVCLYSALHTLQVHRGAAAGFLLPAMASAITIGCDLLWKEDPDSVCCSSLWIASVVGLPFFVFSFFWLNGDQLMFSLVVGSSMLLSMGYGCLTEESQMMAPCFTSAEAILSILMLSVLAGNRYGVLGSLVMGNWYLMCFLKAADIPPFPGKMIQNFVLSISILQLHRALRQEA